MRTTPRKIGTAEAFAVGDRVRKVEGHTDLGREGIVIAVFRTSGGDTLLRMDDGWDAYDRQLEGIAAQRER